VSVGGVSAFPGEPAVVSVSDVHGHPDRFESVLLTPADHSEFEPLVERGAFWERVLAGADEGVDLRTDPESGVVWRGLSFLPPEAPPQVV